MIFFFSATKKASNTFFILVFLHCFCSSAFSAYPKVYNHNGLLSINAKKSDIEQIFDEISKKFSIYIKIYPDMKRKKISVHFQNLNLEESLKKILGENYAIVYSSKNSNKIEKIYILHKGKENKEKLELIEKFHKQIFPNINLLNKVVNNNVAKEHPNAQFYNMIPHYSLNDKLMSYVYTYYTGSDDLPEKSTLEAEVSQAWEIKKKALDEIYNGYDERNSEKISNATKISKEASGNMTREGDFISLEIGASYDQPPVIAFWQGLPLDISQYPRAIDVVKEKTKSENIKFKESYTTGLFTIIFAFESDNQKVYYVDPENWEIFTSWEKRKKRDDQLDIKRVQEIKRRNNLKWINFLDI